MKRIMRLTERDLTRLVRQIVIETEMMDVSQDSDYYKSQKREVSIPQDDLSVLLSAASRFCRSRMGNELGTMSGTELEKNKGVDDCYNVELLNRTRR